jgi:hypothetical protein
MDVVQAGRVCAVGTLSSANVYVPLWDCPLPLEPAPVLLPHPNPRLITAHRSAMADHVVLVMMRAYAKSGRATTTIASTLRRRRTT